MSDSVWDVYIEVSISWQIQECHWCLPKTIQHHLKVVLFCKKSFPLYDEIAELCEDVIATGENAFCTGNSSPSLSVTSQFVEDLSFIDPELLRESVLSSQSASRINDDELDQNEMNKQQHKSMEPSENVCVIYSMFWL